MRRYRRKQGGSDIWPGFVDAMTADLPDGRPLPPEDEDAFAVQVAYWLPEVPLPPGGLPEVVAVEGGD